MNYVSYSVLSIKRTGWAKNISITWKMRSGWSKNFKIVKGPCSLNRYYRVSDNVFDISDQKSSTSYKPIQNYCPIISELFLHYTCRVWACSKKPCPRWWKISGTQRGVHTLIWRNFCQLHKCGQNLILQIIENYGTVTWSFRLLLLRWSEEKKNLSQSKKQETVWCSS